MDQRNELQTVLEEVLNGVIARCENIKIQLDKSRKIPCEDVHHSLLASYPHMIEAKFSLIRAINHLHWNVANIKEENDCHKMQLEN